MNTAKIYYDSDDNECTIHQMVEREPAWAANRIQEGEKAIAKLEELESSRSPGCSNVPTELDVAEDKIQGLETLITVLRADIRELYSMRGEDELTAKYCNAILTATADI